MSEDHLEENFKKNEKIIKKSTFNSLILAIILVTGIAAFFAGTFVSNLDSEQVSQEELENAIAELELKILEKQLPANQPNIPLEISADNDPIIGNPNAPITIIEFSDFQCPFCARFHIETLPTIMEAPHNLEPTYLVAHYCVLLPLHLLLIKVLLPPHRMI